MIGAVREYFLLSDARATGKLLPETARATLSRKLGIGKQRAEAADALWSNGHVAEGLRLAVEAFRETLEAATGFGDAIGARDVKPAPVPEKATEPEPEEKAEAETEDKAEREASEAEAPEAASKSDGEPPTPQPPPDEREGDKSAPPAAREGESARVEAASPDWATVLRQRGISDSKVREIVAAERALASHKLPSLDAEVSASDGELFQQLIAARRVMDRSLGPIALTPRQQTWAQVSRIGFSAFLAIAVVVGLYFILRPVHSVETRASAQFDARNGAANIIDGDPETEWHLPDRQGGWVEILISPPEHIETLRILNGHNRHYLDRAAKDYTVEIFSGGRSVRTIQASWPQFSPRPDWSEHQLNIDDVERIKITVRTWHNRGSSIGEVEW